MKNFKNKVVVITGAGSGIGRSCAVAFAKEGARLHITDIVEEKINDAAAEINDMGGIARPYVVDCGDSSAMARFADDVFDAEGRVDILHNNAGIALGCMVEKISLEDWEKIINVNLWGVIYGVHYFLPKMIEQGGGGHIVITASAAGLTAPPTLAAYSTTKFALVGLAETMNLELPRYGIYTTALCPGIINTPLIAATKMDLCDKQGRPRKEQIVNFYKTKGVGPERVAKDVLKAVRKRRPVQPSPPSHVYPLWLPKRISTGLYHRLVRFGAKHAGYL